MVEEKMNKKLKMRRKTIVSALMVLFIVSIIPALAGQEDRVDLAVTVLSPPVADADGPYFCYRYETILLDGSGSYDPDGEIFLYEWDFGDGTTGTGEKPSHTYSSTGTFTVILTVTDNDELTDSDTTTVKVSKKPSPPPLRPPNKKPKADAGPNMKISVGSTIFFIGSGSYDKDGTIASYNWDFGDGKMALGMNVSHFYTEFGHYTVTLTVKDNRGAEDSDKCHVKVWNPPVPVENRFGELVHGGSKGHVVDASDVANTTVTLNTTESVTVTVLVYDDNPHPGDPIPASALPIYVDVEVSNSTAVEWPIYVEMFYTDEEVEGLDEESLGIYYWDGAWQRCSDTGVDTERNVVWAYMTAEEAAGSPIVVAGMHAIPTPPVPPYLDNLVIAPEELELGDNVTISFDIRNMDSQSITYMVDIQIGYLTFPVDVELEAYEFKTMSRTIFPTAVGIYNVTVMGMTGSFTVKAAPLPAEFVVSGLSITREPLDPRTWTFEIAANVTNIGEQEGTHTVAFKLDGLEVDWRTVTLGGGETAIIVYSVVSGVGSFPFEVDGLTGILEIESIPGPKFEFSDLRIFYPGVISPEVEEGETVTVAVSIEAENVGELIGGHTVELKVNESVVDSQEVTLEGGASETVLFELTRGEGTYQVEVEGMTDTFTVVTEIPPGISVGYFAGVIIVIVAAATILYFGWKGKIPEMYPESE